LRDSRKSSRATSSFIAAFVQAESSRKAMNLNFSGRRVARSMYGLWRHSFAKAI